MKKKTTLGLATLIISLLLNCNFALSQTASFSVTNNSTATLEGRAFAALATCLNPCVTATFSIPPGTISVAPCGGPNLTWAGIQVWPTPCCSLNGNQVQCSGLGTVGALGTNGCGPNTPNFVDCNGGLRTISIGVTGVTIN